MNVIARCAVFGAAAAALAVPPLAAADNAPIDLPDRATFGAIQIPTDTAVGLGLACNEVAAELTCYLSQREADAALDALVLAGSCTPGMHLYDGTSYAGASITITTQSTWINLSTMGFNNVTSSWKAGCVAGRLADGTSGSGTISTLPAGGSTPTLGAFNNLASSAKRCPC